GTTTSAGQGEGRQQEAEEGGDPQRLEGGPPELAQQLSARVAALVPRELVHRAPEPRMLRDGQEHAAARSQRPMHLREHGFVVRDVLEDVERAGHVELAPERQVPGIELEHGRPRQADGGALEPAQADVAAGDAQLGVAPPQAVQDEPAAASDLDEPASGPEVSAQGPYDEPLSCAEPEMPLDRKSVV